MKQIRNIILGLFVIMEMASGFEIDPFPEEAPLLEIFSINCLQMTQSQQMLKAYIMVGLNSNFQNPKEKLSKAIPIYDKRMHQVRAYFHERLDSHEEAKKAFDDALVLWNESKKMLLEAPTHENALQIKKNFLIMINKLLEGTQPLATPDLELISLTGKLCRKPLEVTIDYLMRVWGVEVPNYKTAIKKTIDNYHENLKILSANKLNNEESQELLKKAKRSFTFFEFMYNSKSKFIPSLLSKKADDNFVIIREVKKVFKKQAAH